MIMNKQPWLLDYTPWKSQPEFYNYIRGGLRKAVWARHPVKIEYLKANRFKVPLGKITKKNPEGLVWACKCEQCGETFLQKECEVDHIDGAGGLSSPEDIERFITKLSFVDFDDIQIVDKECHRTRSYSDRMGIPFDEARKKRLVISIMKDKHLKEILMKDFGVAESDVSNSHKRKKVVSVLVEEGRMV